MTYLSFIFLWYFLPLLISIIFCNIFFFKSIGSVKEILLFDTNNLSEYDCKCMFLAYVPLLNLVCVCYLLGMTLIIKPIVWLLTTSYHLIKQGFQNLFIKEFFSSLSKNVHNFLNYRYKTSITYQLADKSQKTENKFKQYKTDLEEFIENGTQSINVEFLMPLLGVFVPYDFKDFKKTTKEYDEHYIMRELDTREDIAYIAIKRKTER